LLLSERLEIRPLAPSDYSSALTVYRQSPGFIVELNGHLPKTITLSMVEEEAQEAAAHGALYCGISLRDSEEMIGIATFERSHHAGKSDTAWIALLMIAEPFHHRGYGKEAYHAVEKFIFADGLVRQIGLGVLPGNTEGREFWRIMGYRDAAPSPDQPEPSVVIMRKTRAEARPAEGQRGEKHD
jgi:RimJ/RimL family protein N-acetyltransferase